MAVEQRRPAVVATATTPGPQPMMSSKAAASGIGEAIDAMATTQAVITAPAVPEEGSDSTISRLKRFQEAARRQNRDLEARDVPADTSPALLLSAETAPFDAANYPQTEDTASEVSFAEIQPPPDDVPMDSSMKHVRVRSNVDILSELEKLRKIATQRPAMPGGSHKSKSAADFSLDDLLGSARNHRKDVEQSFDLEAFRDALETFRIASRPGNPSDLAFASELHDSIALYRPAIEAGARAAEAERPPAEDPRDSLVATAPLPSPDEVEKAKTEVGSASSGTGFDIPIVVNDAVLRAVAFYQFRTPMAFAAALKRSGRY